MIRVRVLFLEPGDLIHPSELDDGITEYTIKEGRMVYGEDYADFNVYKINSAALADSICIGYEEEIKVLSTPNDPCMEMLVPLTVVYFDIIEINSDWHSPGGGIGWSVESIGIWETFGDDYATLVAHAKTLLGRPTAHKDAEGTKVQFMVMYEWGSWTDYWGEWDCDHRLVGLIEDFTVRKFGQEKQEQPPPPDEVLSL
jgi:hypothetical protein